MHRPAYATKTCPSVLYRCRAAPDAARAANSPRPPSPAVVRPSLLRVDETRQVDPKSLAEPISVAPCKSPTGRRCTKVRMQMLSESLYEYIRSDSVQLGIGV